jgi:ABC transporter, ATP-binding protein
LILDEPESNLDFYNQGRVLKTLKKLSRQNKTTIIINSHHIQNMLIIADKGLLLSEGHFLFGSIDLLITNENIKTFFNSDVFVLPVLHEGQSFKTFVVKL